MKTRLVECGRLRVYIGPDMTRALPAHIYVGWCVPGWCEKAKRHRYGMIEHVWAASLSWEWLPRLLRLGLRDVSWSWTGRHFEIVGCRWEMCGSLSIGRWSKGFSLGRLWGAGWA